VLCTYGYVLQIHFYKYFAALPLNKELNMQSINIFAHE